MRGFATLAGLVLAVSTFQTDFPGIRAQAPPARAIVPVEAEPVPSQAAAPAAAEPGVSAAEIAFRARARARLAADVDALATFRPSYPFWEHIFTTPDGNVAFGSRTDGRLLATFPSRGDWRRNGVWAEPSLADTLSGRRLPGA